MIGYETMQREPAGHDSGRCSCGARVQLRYFTNDCERCGKLYNAFGQELQPEAMREESLEMRRGYDN